MIPATAGMSQPPAWLKAMAESFRDVRSLCDYLQITPDDMLQGRRLADFPLRVTRFYASLMQKGDAQDPLLRQVLPSRAELIEKPGFVADPVGDLAATSGPGLLKKYHGRALLLTTQACAVHCRYCFRQHFPYTEQPSTGTDFAAAVAHIAADASIREVILSGGDPLSLSDQRLAKLLQALNQIPQLKRLRLHTRTPVVLPQRLTRALMGVLSQSNQAKIMVLHINHPNEVTAELAQAIRSAEGANITWLNQTVLLKAVNDQAAVLAQLSERLFEIGVLPYYLHRLDPVAGASHFALPDQVVSSIYEQLRALLPGYLLPRLVEEVPGDVGKRLVV